MNPPRTGDHSAIDTHLHMFRSHDGLLLGGKEWVPAESNGNPPLLCLPGLSRNHRDFSSVAEVLATEGFRVIAFDYRGRGSSQWDETWQNYSLDVEAQDIDAGIEALGLDRFSVLGTSRGGLHAMMLPAHYPDRSVKIVLNDIGPVLETEGLMRIGETIGKNMVPGNWTDAADLLKNNLQQSFPRLSDADWQRFSKQLCHEVNGSVRFDYDPALAKTLPSSDVLKTLPDLWPLFDAGLSIPALVLRGEHSNLFSAKTFDAMISRFERAEGWVVPAEGHAPLLWDQATQSRIAEFLRAP